MKEIDWSKAPDGATHYDSNDNSDTGWTKIQGGDKFYYTSNDGGAWVPFTMSADSYGCGKLIPRPTQWKGPQDGLPPEGTNCRVVQTINNYMVCKDATITYQGNGVGCYINNDNGMEYSVSHHDYSFRLIETKKDKATYELARDLGDICPMPEVVNKVIDLGYRKPIDRETAIYNIQRLVPDLDTAKAMAIADMLGHED